MPALIFRLDIFGTASTRRVLGADVADVVRSNPSVIVLLFNQVQHVTKAIDGERPCLWRLPLDLDLRVSADFTFYGTPEISEYGIEHAHGFAQLMKRVPLLLGRTSRISGGPGCPL